MRKQVASIREYREFLSIGETVVSEILPNGLTIYVIPKPGFTKSYAFFATNYGGADRRFQLGGKWLDTPAGIAHFLEHKLFDTPDGGNALADLAAHGASPNAFTSSEITAYHFSSADHFQENLKTLLEFVSVPYFTEESVRKEQGIIGQEIRMIEDSPGSVLYYNFLKALYKNHPMRDTVAGTVESIAEITAQTLYDCHKVFYNPANMVLCVAGDQDPAAVFRLAEEVLPKDGGEIPVKDYGKPEARAPFQEKVEAKMAVSIPVFLAGTKVLTPLSDYLETSLAGELAMSYIGGKSSPLYARLYADGLITSEMDAETDVGRSFAYAAFSAETREPERVIDEIKKEIAQIRKDGLDHKRLEQVKRAAMGGVIRSLNSFENICYNQAEAYFAGSDYFKRYDTLQNMESDAVFKFIQNHMHPEDFGASIIYPV